MATVAPTKPSWGGRRHGKSLEEHLRDGTFIPSRHDPNWQPREKPADLQDPAAYVAERIGLSPRMAVRRPDLAERFEVVSPGEHLDRFGQFFCRHTRAVPNGPELGSPFALEVFQREFFDEALACNERGERIYSFAGMVIPRKNGKTSIASLLALYMASPADGEHRPEVILGAGTLKQAGKLWENAVAFIDDKLYGSVELRRLFLAQANAIHCPSVSGKIERVAGDGDSNHSLDPHVVAADELHTWKTPKQRENWKALTTAQGGRVDPIVLFLSTEGEGDDNELAALLDRLESSQKTEREQRSRHLTIYRNADSGDLVYVYAIPEKAALEDIDEFAAANPAPWRTIERLAKDLLSPRIDAPSKARLYGNRRSHHRDQWISNDKWAECRLPSSSPEDEDFIPADSVIALGADGARTRDTTVVAWVWKDDDGKQRIRCRVWSLRDDVPYHVLVPGTRLDNDLARDFVRDALMPRFQIQLLLYDERYFGDQAADLAEDGLTVAEMYQGKPEMQAAWDGFYQAIHEGDEPSILHDGCPVLAAHVQAAIGIKTERGWRVSKRPSGSSRHADRPIDALAAAVMATHASLVEVESSGWRPL
jgi:phage terminase large subunit-like protein